MTTDHPSSVSTTTFVDNQFLSILWTFDSTLDDVSQNYHGRSLNNASFSNLTITGYGSSLSLDSSLSQAVLIDNSRILLNNRSWTFEAWIYPENISSLIECGIIGQCQALSDDRCLHLTIRNSALYSGFYKNDLNSSQLLNASTWYHVAFLFDCVTRNQSIYLNGIMQNNRLAQSCFQGVSNNLTIGRSDNYFPIANYNGSTGLFNGSIDQLSFVNRSKTPEEILEDATLVLYYSFDNQLMYDQGPLRINATAVGNISSSSSRIRQSLRMGGFNYSYLLVRNLVLLGTSGRSYSISLWIKPDQIQQSSLLYLSREAICNGSWCLSLLGLSNASRLISFSWNSSQTSIDISCSLNYGNLWTHVGVSYSQGNGLRLYINGTSCNSSAPFSYEGPGPTNYLFLGSDMNANAATQNLSSGQYNGEIDEFRIYSRELTDHDMLKLANVV